MRACDARVTTIPSHSPLSPRATPLKTSSARWRREENPVCTLDTSQDPLDRVFLCLPIEANLSPVCWIQCSAPACGKTEDRTARRAARPEEHTNNSTPSEPDVRSGIRSSCYFAVNRRVEEETNKTPRLTQTLRAICPPQRETSRWCGCDITKSREKSRERTDRLSFQPCGGDISE